MMGDHQLSSSLDWYIFYQSSIVILHMILICDDSCLGILYSSKQIWIFCILLFRVNDIYVVNIFTF